MSAPEPLPGAIQLPDGCWVRGRGLRDGEPGAPDPDRALYIGNKHREVARPWPHEWIDWPDFWLPRDRSGAITQIRTLHAQAKSGQRVEVACGGGIGRTGTVIACLAILSGVAPTKAVAWTRTHYHRRAVETPWQRRWVTHFPPPA